MQASTFIVNVLPDVFPYLANRFRLKLPVRYLQQVLKLIENLSVRCHCFRDQRGTHNEAFSSSYRYPLPDLMTLYMMHYCFPCFLQRRPLLGHLEESLSRRTQHVWWLSMFVSEESICDVIPLLCRCLFICLSDCHSFQPGGLFVEVRTQLSHMILN